MAKVHEGMEEIQRAHNTALPTCPARVQGYGTVGCGVPLRLAKGGEGVYKRDSSTHYVTVSSHQVAILGVRTSMPEIGERRPIHIARCALSPEAASLCVFLVIVVFGGGREGTAARTAPREEEEVDADAYVDVRLNGLLPKSCLGDGRSSVTTT